MPGGAPVYYSCRPGGPYIYDLLDTLPLAQFGAITWSVLEREEEIFESDDIRDVDKVMHALWARWVTLHRVQFVADAYDGTIAFIDEYWRMIHRAAGWDALRSSCLFLTGHEVANVLRHYDSLTGRAFWYPKDE
ncbi:hypothetical protein BD779DRAFT_1550327 [Infundibulicybe gibba]|nr:hypothetical protein BD779DRAFT_1550327 [Infundibulicybe gibba]